MTAVTIFLVLLTVSANVAGQVFMKHGMNLAHRPGPKAGVVSTMAAGIGLLALYFFLWLGLLQKMPLSKVFPFDGISPVLLVLAGWLLLRERMTWRAWLGVAMVSAGTALVGMS